MTCHSGGTVDIFLEPMLPAPRLLVYGVSPTARALAKLGKAMGYRVDVLDPDATPGELPPVDGVHTDLAAIRAPGAAAVVASMGEHDEDAVAAALAGEPAYLGVVASRKRFAQLRDTLSARGIPSAALDRIHSPAGLDLGGRLPEELALSILAEIVKLRRETVAPAPAKVAEEIDPVCGMTVVVAGARHVGEWDGRTWYFCNARCKDKFLADPQRFLLRAAP
jgi:xanthine dehydrogenase accessory factor